MANPNAECYALTFQGDTPVVGGLVKAHKQDNGGVIIRLDGGSTLDKSCQFCFHKHVDKSTSIPQSIYRIESVEYKDYHWYWNDTTKKVYLMNYSDSDDLTNIKNIWWVMANNPDGSGSKLFQPFKFPGPSNMAPYNLAFEDQNQSESTDNCQCVDGLDDGVAYVTAYVTACESCALKKGLLSLDPLNKQ